MARLKDFYTSTVVPELMKQFGYKSIMEVPRIEKITLNMGVATVSRRLDRLEAALGVQASKRLLPVQPGDMTATAADTRALAALADMVVRRSY